MSWKVTVDGPQCPQRGARNVTNGGGAGGTLRALVCATVGILVCFCGQSHAQITRTLPSSKVRIHIPAETPPQEIIASAAFRDVERRAQKLADTGNRKGAIHLLLSNKAKLSAQDLPVMYLRAAEFSRLRDEQIQMYTLAAQVPAGTNDAARARALLKLARLDKGTVAENIYLGMATNQYPEATRLMVMESSFELAKYYHERSELEDSAALYDIIADAQVNDPVKYPARLRYTSVLLDMARGKGKRSLSPSERRKLLQTAYAESVKLINREGNDSRSTDIGASAIAAESAYLLNKYEDSHTYSSAILNRWSKASGTLVKPPLSTEELQGLRSAKRLLLMSLPLVGRYEHGITFAREIIADPGFITKNQRDSELYELACGIGAYCAVQISDASAEREFRKLAGGSKSGGDPFKALFTELNSRRRVVQ